MTRGPAVVSTAMAAMVALGLGGLVVGTATAASRTTPPVGVLVPGEKRTADVAGAIDRVAQGTNRLRQQANVPPLSVATPLAAAALEFSAYMARTGRYGHDADGRRPAERARAAGYDDCIVAENIAYQYLSTGFSTDELAESLLDGWMDSPGHRANLLDPDVTEIGVGIARSAVDGRYYAVQLFGRPARLRTSFSLGNATDRTLAYELGGRSHVLPPGTTVRHQDCRRALLVLRGAGDPPTMLQAVDAATYTAVRTADGGIRFVESAP